MSAFDADLPEELVRPALIMVQMLAFGLLSEEAGQWVDKYMSSDLYKKDPGNKEAMHAFFGDLQTQKEKAAQKLDAIGQLAVIALNDVPRIIEYDKLHRTNMFDLIKNFRANPKDTSNPFGGHLKGFLMWYAGLLQTAPYDKPTK